MCTLLVSELSLRVVADTPCFLGLLGAEHLVLLRHNLIVSLVALVVPVLAHWGLYADAILTGLVKLMWHLKRAISVQLPSATGIEASSLTRLLPGGHLLLKSSLNLSIHTGFLNMRFDSCLLCPCLVLLLYRVFEFLGEVGTAGKVGTSWFLIERQEILSLESR